MSYIPRVDSGPSRKRARIEGYDPSASSSHSDAGQGEAKDVGVGLRDEDEEFWYDDGNIIIVARGVGFRVFKGILADHSLVFKDMFSIPQPRTASSTSEPGCPVVSVTDAPEDLRRVLRVIMPKSPFSPYLPSQPTYDAISATIRLGHKYQMSILVSHSIEYLKTHFTCDFNVWSRTNSYLPSPFPTSSCIGIVNLARLTGEDSLLPTAFLACCTIGPDIARGHTREDGSQEYLPLDDIGLCFGAVPRLIQARVIAASHIFNPRVARDCKSDSRCRRQLRKLLQTLDNLPGSLAHPDPLLPFVYDNNDRAALCVKCQDMVVARDRDERVAIWKRLPALLGIEVKDWPGSE